VQISPREVRQLQKQNRHDPVCDIKKECHICHIGFMIPLKYTDKKGKPYRYNQIKPKIENLDPQTVMERMYEPENADMVMFIDPKD